MDRHNFLKKIKKKTCHLYLWHPCICNLARDYYVSYFLSIFSRISELMQSCLHTSSWLIVHLAGPWLMYVLSCLMDKILHAFICLILCNSLLSLKSFLISFLLTAWLLGSCSNDAAAAAAAAASHPPLCIVAACMWHLSVWLWLITSAISSSFSVCWTFFLCAASWLSLRAI